MPSSTRKRTSTTSSRGKGREKRPKFSAIDASRLGEPSSVAPAPAPAPCNSDSGTTSQDSNIAAIHSYEILAEPGGGHETACKDSITAPLPGESATINDRQPQSAVDDILAGLPYDQGEGLQPQLEPSDAGAQTGNAAKKTKSRPRPELRTAVRRNLAYIPYSQFDVAVRTHVAVGQNPRVASVQAGDARSTTRIPWRHRRS